MAHDATGLIGEAPMAEPKRSRAWLIVAVGALGLAVGAYAWTAQTEPPPENLFRTAPVERRTVVKTVEATGRLRAQGRTMVTSPVPGRLAEVLVEPRDRVEAGQPLARLDARTLAMDVRKARASVAASEGRVAQAEAQLAEVEGQRARVKRLADRGQASPAEVDGVASAYAKAKAALQVARAERELTTAALSAATYAEQQTALVAPRAGVVLTVPDVFGTPVGPEGPTLFVLAKPLETLRLQASVGEADIGQLKVGQPCQFEVEAFAGKTFDATIERIGLTANPKGTVVTYPVMLTVPNPDLSLLPGMSATVRFEIGRAENAWAVRAAALRFVPEGAPEAPPRSRVFKRTGPGDLDVIDVDVGLSDGAYVEIRPKDKNALTAKDEVAIGYQSNVDIDRTQPNISLGGKK